MNDDPILTFMTYAIALGGWFTMTLAPCILAILSEKGVFDKR
tara:strand:- start:78 stop:203 length:126 start_codon:yes stop_codon:yes gene_type:complete